MDGTRMDGTLHPPPSLRTKMDGTRMDGTATATKMDGATPTGLRSHQPRTGRVIPGILINRDGRETLGKATVVGTSGILVPTVEATKATWTTIGRVV